MTEEQDKEIFDKLKNQEDEKTILDYLQDRIGEKLSVGELNSILQSIFSRWYEVFITYDELYDGFEDEPKECNIVDEDDIYTITYYVVDLEDGIIEISDVEVI